MHATMRHYTNLDRGAIAELVRRQAEVVALLRQTPGFAQYDLIQTPDGMTTVTLCASEAGCAESNQRVAAWVKEHMATMLPTPPQIVHGVDVIHATAA